MVMLMQWWPRLVLYMYSGASLIQTLIIQTLDHANTHRICYEMGNITIYSVRNSSNIVLQNTDNNL